MKTAGFAIGTAICYVWGTDIADKIVGCLMWFATVFFAITEKTISVNVK